VPDNAPEMTNNRLGKLLSVENLITIILVVVAVTGSYQSLASDNANTKMQVASVKKQQKEIVKSVATIQLNVAVILNEQQHAKEQMDDQKLSIQRILNILERR